MNKIIDKSIKEHIEITKKIYELNDTILTISKKILSLKSSKNKLFICGNGGSASDSQHFASELVGRFEKNRKGFPAICLSNDSYAITAISNDFGFENVFARQIEALGVSGDILIAISTSGSSANVIKAVNKAKSLGIFCIGLLGREGGELHNMVDLSLLVNNPRTARIQEMHIMIIHMICELIEDEL